MPAPRLESDHAALVRPTVVASCDADGYLIDAGVLKGPIPLGHEGLGVVEEVGDAVTTLQPGDTVLIPWKISCGFCRACSFGLTAQCQSVPHEAMYGWGGFDSWGSGAPSWGGFLSDTVLVPWAEHMLCPLPPGADPLSAAGCSDNITDGWRAVGPALAARTGARALVLGGGGPGSIGLYAAGWACALGAAEVVYLDPDPVRRSVAESYGAVARDISSGLPADLEANFDVTVDAGRAGPEGLTWLLGKTGPGGLCTCTAAMSYLQDAPVPIFHMYRKSISLTTGWAHTRALMQEPLQHIAEGRFDPTPVTTKVLPFAAAAEALADDHVKLIFTRD